MTTAGTAVFKFRPGPGSHSYKAVFVGTNSYSGSVSVAAALTVSPPAKYPSFATITATSVTGTNNYNLSASVSGTGSSAPTGTVSIVNASDGNALLGAETLGAGMAEPGFFNSSTPGTDFNPDSVVVGDFNADGIPDLALTNSGSNTVTILLGNGDGTFTAAASPATAATPTSIAAGDFNGDGNLDLAVGNDGASNNLTILLGNGDGTFTAAASPATGGPTSSIAVGDFNGDGIPDLAVTNGGVTILLGNGDGTFRAAPNISAGGAAFGIAVGDFNGDGITDLAVTNNNGNPTEGTVTILLGNGDGTFRAAASTASGVYPWGIVAGDFNGDGNSDLAVANLYGTVTILLGNGDGTFTAASNPSAGLSAMSIAVGDFNGDGIPDLAVTNEDSNTVTVLLGDGAGNFAAVPRSPATGNYPQFVAVGDFNGDGLDDLAVANADDNTVTVLLVGNQMATTAATPISLAPGASMAVVAKYAGDTNYNSSNSSTITLPEPIISTALSLTAIATTAAMPVTLTATLTPDSALGYSTNGQVVTFIVEPFGSGVPNNLGSATLKAGVATLTVPSLTPGSYTVVASFAGSAVFASTSTAIQFELAAVQPVFTLAVTPSAPIVGQPVTLTATLSPYTVNGQSSDGESINFQASLSAGGSNLSRLGTATLSGGIATLTLSSIPAGTYSLQAIYGGDVLPGQQCGLPRIRRVPGPADVDLEREPTQQLIWPGGDADRDSQFDGRLYSASQRERHLHQPNPAG